MEKKVILITGASSGIGKAAAERLIKEGHIVYCAARSIDKMEELEKMENGWNSSKNGYYQT